MASAAAGQARRLTLQEAVELAKRQNHSLKAAAYAVAAEQQKKRIAASDYYPVLSNETNVLHVTDLQRVEVPAGAFGTIPNGPLIPASTVYLTQGTETLETSGTMIAQPLTQLIKIHAANRAAVAEVKSVQASLADQTNTVVYRVHELYYRILTAHLQKTAAELQIEAGRENLGESVEQVKKGSALEVTRLEGESSLLEARQTLLNTNMQLSDLTTQLNDLLGLPLGTDLDLDSNVDVEFVLPPREQAVEEAMKGNPEIAESVALVNKAKAALSAARAEYIPDLSAFARHSYQNGLPLFDRNFGTIGFRLTYDIFDGGKREARIRERRNEIARAEEMLKHAQEEVEVRVTMVYNRLEVTRSMIEVSREYLKTRQESARLAEDQYKQGTVLASQMDLARAQAKKAEASLLDASLAYQLAHDDLVRVLGSPLVDH
jgi:outer membrane protein TolC